MSGCTIHATIDVAHPSVPAPTFVRGVPYRLRCAEEGKRPMEPCPNLFSPLELQGVTLRNRIVQLPIGLHFTADGQPTADDVAYYEARARGGVALVITGGTVVHPSQVASKRELYEAFDPAHIPAFEQLTAAVHRQGAKIFGQLMHNGREPLARNPDWPTLAPSAIAPPGLPVVPQQLSETQIADLTAGYVRSARNLREAGYDGIEIHAAHGFLVAQFLSPLANHRQDRYGGSLENRMRFLLDIVEEVRAECGHDFPLGVRISGEEGLEGGLTVPDSQAIARRLGHDGAVDYISVNIGVRGTYVRDMATAHGIVAPTAATIRAASGLAVLVAQRITEPLLAESVLAAGQADLIGMARGLIADPEWVRKARDGHPDQIRPCVGLTEACRMGAGALASSRGGPIACNHNPSAGRERELGDLSSVDQADARAVVVVGGGPAGLEAALVAAARGHRVRLYEARERLGGQILMAANAPTRAEVEGVVSYRIRELHRLGVPMHVGMTATVDTVLAVSPDVVILATGATATLPDIPGADSPNVRTVFDLLDPLGTTSDALLGVERAVVVDDGSGTWETCSAAEYLAERGIEVEIITPARMVGAGIPPESIGPLYARLARRQVTLTALTAVASVEPSGLLTYQPHVAAATGIRDERKVSAEIVVLYGGKRASNPLQAGLEKHVDVLAVGDCVAPRRITEAVLAAHRAARAV